MLTMLSVILMALFWGHPAAALRHIFGISISGPTFFLIWLIAYFGFAGLGAIVESKKKIEGAINGFITLFFIIWALLILYGVIFTDYSVWTVAEEVFSK
jgi:hypothetical protein